MWPRGERLGLLAGVLAGIWIVTHSAQAAGQGRANIDRNVGAVMTAETIVARAIEAAGGETWHRPKSLHLKGYGVFQPRAPGGKVTIADDYQMWRVFDRERKSAHGPAGWVRIDSKAGERVLFQVSFDGERTYDQNGLVLEEKAKTYWANAFGFGVVRKALDPGFTATRLPDDSVDGRPSFFIRVTDPAGGDAVFGISKFDFAIRKVAFDTPRGWHERIYSDFTTDPATGWRQPMLVRLYYDGVKSNEIHWQEFAVNPELTQAHFQLATN